MSTPPVIYTAEQVADILNVSEWFVKDEARKGRIGSFKAGKHVRFTGDDLHQYIERNRQRSLIQRKEVQHEQ